jgi:hypothetical protein
MARESLAFKRLRRAFGCEQCQISDRAREYLGARGRENCQISDRRKSHAQKRKLSSVVNSSRETPSNLFQCPPGTRPQ